MWLTNAGNGNDYCCSQSRRASRHVMTASPLTALDNNINNGVYDSWLTTALTQFCLAAFLLFYLITPPGRHVEYCDQPGCLCVCVCLSVHEHISGIAGTIFTKFCVQIPCGRGSVLLWRRCATLCTSGFMDNVMFGRSGPYGVAYWCLYSRNVQCIFTVQFEPTLICTKFYVIQQWLHTRTEFWFFF